LSQSSSHRASAESAYSRFTKHLKGGKALPLASWSLEIEEKPRAEEQRLSFPLSQIPSSSPADSRSPGSRRRAACGLLCSKYWVPIPATDSEHNKPW